MVGSGEKTAPHGVGRLLVAGVFGGAIAGAGTGAIDGLWSWGALPQFLPGFGGKLQLLLYLAAAYACTGAIAGPVVRSLVHLFSHATRLGDLARFGAAKHDALRAKDPREALVGLSLVIAGIPVVSAMLGGTFVYTAAALARRNHKGLIVAVSMAAALAALVAAVLASFALARLVELLLQRLARGERLGRWLSAPRAPVVAAAVLVIAGGAIAVAASWQTLSLLRLRPYWIALLAGALAWPALRAGERIAVPLLRGRRSVAAATVVATIAAMGAGILFAGSSQSVLKAADHYSGMGGPLTRAYRALGDFDGDGYSRILGGGDCDDWNPDVHPGRVEIPDDGIDQNCIGGDATMQRGADDVGFVPTPASIPDDFNVVMITIDTVRADHFGAYGYPHATTPALDALASDGALFVNAWAHAPSTRYSMPSILTGRYPLAVQYDNSVWWPALDAKATTMAETLEARVFYSGAIRNYHYFDTKRRMDQGFDHYDNSNARLHTGRDPAKTVGTSSRQQTDKAIAFLEQNAHRRFFLWVHYYDPHYSYEPHEGTERFDTGKTALYDHEIRFTDDQIGRVIEDLKQRGLYERTVIVVTGDHGEGFGEHGIDLHGYHLYAPQTKIPLIMRVPGQAPQRVTTPVGHIDLLPTLANLAGAQPSTEMQGRSLVDMLTGQAPVDGDRWVFQQLSFENNNEQRAAASQRCHIIYYVSPQNSWELYRIDTDPGETRDIIDDPGVCAEARAKLEEWYDQSEIPPQALESLLPGRPDLAEPLDVDFGDEVRLLDVKIPDGPVRPGDSIDITFTYEARGRLPDDWNVFVHFEAPGGSRFLGDHAPARPFAWWRAGQFVRYTHTVTVPRSAARGDYVMWMGLFHGNERRPVRSRDARVRVREERAAVGVIRVQR